MSRSKRVTTHFPYPTTCKYMPDMIRSTTLPVDQSGLLDRVLLEHVRQLAGFGWEVQSSCRRDLVAHTGRDSVRVMSGHGRNSPLLVLEIVHLGSASKDPRLAVGLLEGIVRCLFIFLLELHQSIGAHAQDHPTHVVKAAEP